MDAMLVLSDKPIFFQSRHTNFNKNIGERPHFYQQVALFFEKLSVLMKKKMNIHTNMAEEEIKQKKYVGMI